MSDDPADLLPEDILARLPEMLRKSEDATREMHVQGIMETFGVTREQAEAFIARIEAEPAARQADIERAVTLVNAWAQSVQMDRCISREEDARVEEERAFVERVIRRAE